MSGKLVEIRDIVDGLWIWRVQHREWTPGCEWEPIVTSTCVCSGGETMLLDPMAPHDIHTDFWRRIDEQPPTAVVILKPDHVRDVDVFVQRYGCKAYGPSLFWRDDIPETHLVPIQPGTQLPGNLLALYDGRGKQETPLWLPHQRTLVFADALTERDGLLRIWWTPWHQERVVPAMESLLNLPFEHVIISHGEPVHDRAAFERALKLEPWSAHQP